MLHKLIKNRFLLMISIFLFAFILRIFFINIILFDGDIVQQMDYADKISSGDFYLGGMVPTQGDFRTQQTFGPFHFYLLSLVRIISNNYLLSGLFMAFLNSLAVLLTFIFVNKFFSHRLAILSSLLYAVNPWHTILYSNYPWAPNYLPIMIILLFLFLFMVLFENKQIYLLPFAFLLGVITHPYPAGLQIYLVVFLSFLFFYKKIRFNYKILVASILIFIATFLPFILNSYIIDSNPIKEGFTVLSYTQSALKDSTTTTDIIDALAMPFVFSSSYFGDYLTGSFNIFNNILDDYYKYVPFIFAFVFLISMIFFIKNKLIKKDENFYKYLILFLWFIIPITLMVIRNRSVMPHNLIAIFPVFFIVISMGLFSIFDKLKKKSFFIIFLTILILSQLVFIFGFYNFIGNVGGTDGTYGIPYKFKLEAIDYILKDSQTNDPVIFEFTRISEYKKLFYYRKSYPNYIPINNVSEFNDLKGYLILDRVSRDYPRKLTSYEDNYFNSLSNNTKKFGQIEIIKFTKQNP